MYPLIPISSTLNIPTYYLVLSLTVSVSLIWLVWRADRFHLSRKVTLDLSLIIMVTGFIGGRLFHILYEDFDYYRENAARVFYFWNGGFVFYGGAILASLFSMLYLSYRVKSAYAEYLDLFAPVLAFSYILGRCACLLAGCCYGRYCDLPWAVAGRHPTQAYAALWELGALMILLGIEKVPQAQRKPRFLSYAGAVFYLWVVLHAAGRLVMETYRDDFRGPSLGLSISSWISILLILLSGYLLFRNPTSRRSTLST